MYKQNPTHPNDEIIDEIPVLVDRDYRNNKNKKSKSYVGQKEEISVFALKNEMILSNASRKDNHHDDELGHQGMVGHVQIIKKNDNKLILKNILNVRHKKVLTLSTTKESKRDCKYFNKSQSTQANTTHQG